MKQLPEILTIADKNLIGKSLRMSLVNNRTHDLWKSFMVHRKEMSIVLSEDLYSIQVYDSMLDIQRFSPQTEFTKWAAIEVDVETEMNGFNTFVLPGGKYAVFHYTGTPSNFHKMAQYIYGQWLPSSEYILDDRPHFEVLGDKYKRNDPTSEEKVWIPIKLKQT